VVVMMASKVGEGSTAPQNWPRDAESFTSRRRNIRRTQPRSALAEHQLSSQRQKMKQVKVGKSDSNNSNKSRSKTRSWCSDTGENSTR